MINEIVKYDKEFTEGTFLTKADHIFMMLLDAIMQKDISIVKHYLTDEVASKYIKLIKEYSDKKIIRIFDETNVKNSKITNVNIENDKINITVKLNSRYMDYFINEDGDFISGINDRRIEKEHIIVFTKNIDSKNLNEIRRCPYCGNSLDINLTGKCPYCNQIIDMSKYDYIITKISTY